MHRKELQRFAKLLIYILGVRPDEFGLVPDSEGYVSLKELLQALKEEGEWSFIRRSHLHELLHHPGKMAIEIADDRIRATAPAMSPVPEPLEFPPPRLFHGIRKRAHPAVIRHGLCPAKGPWVILSLTRALAFRIGKRRDQDPVILEINAEAAAKSGTRFFGTQGLLFLTTHIEPEYIAGPPLKQEEKARPTQLTPARPRELPGSFLLDPQRIMPEHGPRSGKARDASWRRERKMREKRRKERRKR